MEITKLKQAVDSGNKFDIIIMNLRIPNGISGKEAVKAVLEIDQKARVIVSRDFSYNPVMVNHS